MRCLRHGRNALTGMFAVHLKFYIKWVLPVAVGAVWNEKVHEGVALISGNRTQSCVLCGRLKG